MLHTTPTALPPCARCRTMRLIWLWLIRRMATDSPTAGGGTTVEQIRSAVRPIQTVNRSGFHGKNPYHLGGGEKDSPHKRQTQRTESTGLVERGRRNSEKNHRVGRRPGTGILRATVSRLTLPDHLGGQLLRFAADSVLSCVAQNECSARRVLYGFC